jgi:hypothetical protein
MLELLKAKVRPGPALALGFLVLGLLVDLGFTRIQMRECVRLTTERDLLRQQSIALGRQEERGRTLARALGGDDLSAALGTQTESDPLDYLGRAIARAGLNRMELGTQGTVQSEHVRRIKFFLRASGKYSQILSLIQDLEHGSRVVTIDDFTVLQGAEDPKVLEARVELSIYQPLTGS